MNNDKDAGKTVQSEGDAEPGDGAESVSKGNDLLRTGLLMVSSALLGGIAFAIWNRRQIANIQQQPSTQPGPPTVDDDAIY